MRRLLTAIAILPMLLSAGSAFAETCTFSTSGNWTSATAFSGTADDCTLSADDNIIIADTARVTITTGSTVLQDGTTASTGVTVRSGGSLVMQPGSRIDLNVNGLNCQAGSTCTFEGGYRQFGVASPGVTTDIGATNVWHAGDLALSPGGDDTLFQFNYPLAKYDSAENDPFLTDSIAGVDATDVIMFYAPDVNDKNPPVDEGFFYEVSSVDTTGDYGMTFEVRQGARDTGYPLARRDILATTLSVAAKAGDRVLTLTGAASVPSNDYYNGRMVRFETSSGSGIPENMSYRIMDSTTAATDADTIKIADANGIIAAKASGDVVWIDYGWKKGDSFYVMKPALIKSATLAEEDSDVTLSGTYTLTASVIDGTGVVTVDANSTQVAFSDVWLSDVTDSTSTTLAIDTVTAATFERLSITGGSAVVGDDVNRPIAPSPSAGSSLTFNMVAIRHAGSDYLSLFNNHTGSLAVERFRCQFRSTNGNGQGCLQGQVNGTFGDFRYTAKNVEVLDALNLSSAFTNYVSVNNALLIANTGAIHHPGTGTTGPANNAYFVGNSMDLSGAASFPTNGRNFVSRDNVNLSAGASLIRGPVALNAKDGLVIGNSFDLIGIEQGSGIIQNVAFINNIALSSLTTTRMFFMATADPHPEFTLKNLLLVDENSELRYGIFARSPATAEGIENVTIDSVGFSDFNFVSGANTARVFQDSIGLHVAHNRGTNLCFFNVQEEANGIASINTANTWTRGIPPSFVNPEKSRYNSSSGTAWSDLGCGLSKTKPAGVCKMNRTLSWSNLQPECMADFGIGGGGSSPNFAPRAFGNFL